MVAVCYLARSDLVINEYRMNGEWIHGRRKPMHCNGRPEAASCLHLIALEGFLIENPLVIYTKLDTQVVSPLQSTRRSFSPFLVP